jgi:two-component system, NtrC family, response regulator PilR
MQQLREMIAKVARSQAPVHISGDSGTGKELVARLIHESGRAPDGPFVPVNCGAIPSELMESELFGHKKGSFTGAVADKEGLIRSAEGGTLFLDEVADLPLHMQVKLLRVIQEKSVRPSARRARCRWTCASSPPPTASSRSW